MAVSQIIGASIADGTIAAIDITDGTITTAKLSATTGSGNVVLSAAPTLTGNTSLVNLTVSGTQTNSTLTSGRVRYSTTGGVLTDSSNLQFDGSNLGVGVTPSSWSVVGPAMQFGGGSINGGSGSFMQVVSNAYYDGSNYKYVNTDYASRYVQNIGVHSWSTSPSGTAGNAITFTTSMTLDASGYLGIGTTSPSSYGGLAVRKAVTVSNVPVSASFSDSANSTFDIRHSANIVNLNAQGSGITINTGNSTRITITDAGNVGIGTASPSVPLHILNSGEELLRLATSGVNPYLSFYTGTSTRKAYIQLTSSGLVLDSEAASTGQIFLTQGVERMRITSAGLVGIGTGAPAAALGILATGMNNQIVLGANASNANYGSISLNGNSADNSRLGFTGGGSGDGSLYIDAPTGGSYAFRLGATQPLTILSTGNVGINNVSPATKLDVDGTGYFRNLLYISGSHGISSDSASPILFKINGTEKMQLDASGNLGIGTSSPSTYGKVAIVVTGTATPTTGANVGPASINLFNGGGGGTTNSTMGIFGWHAGEPGLGSGIGFSRDSSGDWAASIRFYTHPSATSNINVITERMRITGDGNVGIGTSSPSARLSIIDSNMTSQIVLGVNPSNTVYGGISFNGNLADGTHLGIGGGGSGDANLYIDVPTGGSHIFRQGSSSTTVMQLASSGFVGLGITSPSYNLQVYNNSDVWHFVAGGATGQVRIGGQPTGGGVIGAYSPDNTPRPLYLQRDGNNVLIGTTTIVDAYSALLVLQAAYPKTRMEIRNDGETGALYAITFRNGNGLVGSITTSGSATSFATSSDYRLKRDVQPMTGALAKVIALKPVTYKWKADGSDGEGFIAHELQAVIPNSVLGEKDDVNDDGSIKPQGVDTSFLVATLTAAIQEQQALIESLSSRLTALEGK